MSEASTTDQSIIELLHDKARGNPRTVESCLSSVDAELTVEGTRAAVRVHCIKLDGTGRPMVTQLIDMICECVIDYAIPRRAIAQAMAAFEETGSTQHIARLTKEARELFTTLATTGEGGELLLFLLAERVLRLPQIFSKMYLKTSTSMHYHGSDGIHAGVSQDGNLVLFWGESKLHANRTQAVLEAMRSLAPYLKDSGQEGIRDLQLIRSHLDLDDESLEQAILAFLCPDSPQYGQAEYRGLALVGFDSDSYPKNPNELGSTELLALFSGQVEDWKKHLSSRIKIDEIGDYELNVFFVPFVSVQEFREEFLLRIGN